jgi:hypothetical protein
VSRIVFDRFRKTADYSNLLSVYSISETAMYCLQKVKLQSFRLKLIFEIATFTLTLIMQFSSTHEIRLNSESSNSVSVIDINCTIVNIDLAKGEKDYIELTTTIQFQSVHEALEQNILRQSSGNILLHMNHSDLNNFQKLNKRPTLQKAGKNCFQAILNLPNS